MSVLSGLKPEKVFEYFEKLCSVPHGSGNTKMISDMCVGFAKELGLRCRQDSVNNVVIWKDASPGCENAEPIILQGHIDMVCVKTDDCLKDMSKEGLDLMTDGVDIWADKTSLGADNGIAVAMILAALADDTLTHPPLEAVFTVDEETGMDGAFALDCSDIRGRKLLNLDSEAEGVFTVSCAGGLRADIIFEGTVEAVENEKVYTLSLSGLQGGHSGADINLGRGSANTLMIRTLYSVMERLGSIRLCSIHGGRFDNVICSSCEAVAAVPADKAGEFEAFVHEFDGILKNEYAACDAGISLELCPAESDSGAMCADDSRRMLTAVYAMPQGVQEMSRDFENLVQTSMNMGVINLSGGRLCVSCSVRSCIASQKLMMLQKLRAITELAGGSISTRSSYPGWQFMKQSKLRDTVMEAFHSMYGRDAVLEATHGGLECGLFIEKLPGLDAISLGPELRDIHSVNERLSIASTQRVYELVCQILRRSCMG